MNLRPRLMSFCFVLLCAALGVAQTPAAAAAKSAAPRALIVVAHPDDESCFAATVYEITHNLGGTVDQLVITNGEGGYRYSLLAESYYGVALTDEAVGRKMLPEIRKRELMEAGRILGISNHFFLDQRDVRYTQDIDEVLEQHWQQGVVLPEVTRRLESGNYDYVFTLFPTPDTHGGHKAATLTALQAAQQMKGAKPVVLGCQWGQKDGSRQPSWEGYKSEAHPFRTLPGEYTTDRTVKFGFRDAISYQTIVNWEIAAHKSQGQMQNAYNHGELEEFAVLDDGLTDEAARAGELFKALQETAAHPRRLPADVPAAHLLK
ncbi:MAG: PIG-L family deacetylase [Acidobacteriota bacterium]|nr:PIG-L family deacetylase [Acidobacteriota bacterium]